MKRRKFIKRGSLLVPVALGFPAIIRADPLYWPSLAVAPAAAAGASITVTNAAKASDSTGVQTKAISFSPTSGRNLILCMGAFQGSSTNHAVTDNIDGATGWTRRQAVDGNGSVRISMWTKFNIPSGITSITMDAGTSGTFPSGCVHEVTGISAFTGGETNGAAGTTNLTTAAVNNATANSIFFAMASDNDASNPTTYTLNQSGTVGTWALFNSTNSQELNGASLTTFSVPYVIVSSVNSGSKHAWTSLGSGAQGILCVH